VPEIYANDKLAVVTKRPSGIISIRIGEVPDAILHTKISSLILQPRDQFSGYFAVFAIEGAQDVQNATAAFGLHEVLPTFIDILTFPPSDRPHLPSSITNVTMDQALDLVASTFKGIVLYGACTQPPAFSIEFVGGFDDKSPER